MRESQFRDKTKKLAANGNPIFLLSVSVLAEQSIGANFNTQNLTALITLLSYVQNSHTNKWYCVV